MKRKRIIVTDGIYHLMSRCCLGEHLLEDGEKEMFIRMMRRQAAFCGVDLLAYSIMSNHFHILARVRHEKPQTDVELLSRYRAFHEGCRISPYSMTPDGLEKMLERNDEIAQHARDALLARMGDVSVFMRELKQRFSIWYNHQNGNRGTLWIDRFKSLVVEPSLHAMATVAADQAMSLHCHLEGGQRDRRIAFAKGRQAIQFLHQWQGQILQWQNGIERQRVSIFRCGAHGGDGVRQRPTQLRHALRSHGQAGRASMAAETFDQVCIGGNRRAQVNAGHRARRATRQPIRSLRQQQRRAPVLLGQAVGDDTKHAGVPVRIQQNQHLPIQQRRLARQHLLRGRFHLIAQQLAFVVQPFQLSSQDARRGRIYLPMSDLQKFNVKAHELINYKLATKSSDFDDRFQALMAFQSQRAHALYDEAMQLLPTADVRSQKPGLMMASIYRTLLSEIEKSKFPVLHERVRLTPLRKLWLAWKVQALGKI